jgi:hypothetical protein
MAQENKAREDAGPHRQMPLNPFGPFKSDTGQWLQGQSSTRRLADSQPKFAVCESEWDSQMVPCEGHSLGAVERDLRGRRR